MWFKSTLYDVARRHINRVSYQFYQLGAFLKSAAPKLEIRQGLFVLFDWEIQNSTYRRARNLVVTLESRQTPWRMALSSSRFILHIVTGILRLSHAALT